MERVKVIEYISSLGDGGAETLVKDYVRLIDRERFEPIIVILNGGGTSANRRILEESQIPIIELLPQWNIFVRIWKKLFGWWYIPHRLRKIIREESAHVLHMHLIVLKDVPRIGKALKGVRLFFTCHSKPEIVFSKNLEVERKAAEQLIRNDNMQLIALHREMAAELNEMFGVKNTSVIRNGVDFSRFKSVLVNKSEKRRELCIPSDAFVVGHVGSFKEAKNHKFLVEVFAEIAQRRDDAFLLMVGAGDTIDTEKRLADTEQKLRDYGLADRYAILSHRGDVNEIMQVMDVFVFPSIYEGLGIALIEAQVSGLRCIASDVIPKEAFRSENAIALPLKDPASWAITALDTTVKGCPYGALNEYDINEEIKRLEKLYLGELLS